ncbi:hypothetical protein Bca4012_003119 [Brassica carinata]
MYRVDVTCALCKNAAESRSHLFFECSYSSQIWENLMLDILRGSYTTDWNAIVALLKQSDRDKKRSFCLRYGFQTIIYVIWRERNKITHGESPLPMNAVKKLIDKGVRNKLSLLRSRGGKGTESALQYWFSTRT